MAMLLTTASLMNCGDSAAGHRGTIPVPARVAAALMLRLAACCSGVLPGVAVRLRNGPKSSNSSIIVTPKPQTVTYKPNAVFRPPVPNVSARGER
jgi:hypothetical protein